jgi:alpha-glucosidase
VHVHKDHGAWGTQLHLHDRGHPDVHEVYRDVRRLLDRRGAVAIGELHVFDLPRLCAYYGEALDELHLPFNFTLLATPWEARAVRRAVDAMEAALPPGAWPTWVLGNHDERRIATRVGAEAARAAMVLLLTLRGTPTLYYGDELGMEDVPIPPELAQDPWGKNVPGLGLGRDPARTPMPWDGSSNAGFTAPGGTPWLPLGANRARNVGAQSADPASMLSLTRALLRLRRSRPALHAGSYRPLDAAPEGVFAFARADGGDEVVIAVNFQPVPARVHLGRASRALLSTHGDAALAAGALLLRPHEAVVVTSPA